MTERFRPMNLPKCECFNFDEDEDYAMKACTKAGKIAELVAVIVEHEMDKYGFCREATPFIFEQMIIVMITKIALEGTIIEHGTDEALWESERVLKGMEERVLASLKHDYKWSQLMGLTQAKVNKMKKSGKWQ